MFSSVQCGIILINRGFNIFFKNAAFVTLRISADLDPNFNTLFINVQIQKRMLGIKVDIIFVADFFS